MDSWAWLPHNLAEVFGYIGVIGGLVFNGISIRAETKARRITNMLMITENHREIWNEFSRNQNVWRVLDPSANTLTEKITPAEEAFVVTVIQQTSSTHQAMRDRLTIDVEGIRRDVRNLFTLPVFRAVWNKMKEFQNEDFVVFVESCLDSK